MHIDATFSILRPGLILVNPERGCHQIEIFKKAGWDVVDAAQPLMPKGMDEIQSISTPENLSTLLESLQPKQTFKGTRYVGSGELVY